jgi:hypothetical protein
MIPYLTADAELIRAKSPADAEPPAHSEGLFLIYAVRMRAKGEAVTAADVHDAWAAWIINTQGMHNSLVPFELLDPNVQQEDLPYVEAIRRAARRRAARD